jgi:hypothetical protein
MPQVWDYHFNLINLHAVFIQNIIIMMYAAKSIIKNHDWRQYYD